MCTCYEIKYSDRSGLPVSCLTGNNVQGMAVPETTLSTMFNCSLRNISMHVDNTHNCLGEGKNYI